LNLSIRAANVPVRNLFFEIDEVTIGRDPSCGCRLDDDNVSNYHARLKYHHTQWWLEDLGSTNGTLINDQPVTTPIVIVSGDEVACGKHIITIEISGEGLNNSRFIISNSGDENG